MHHVYRCSSLGIHLHRWSAVMVVVLTLWLSSNVGCMVDWLSTVRRPTSKIDARSGKTSTTVWQSKPANCFGVFVFVLPSQVLSGTVPTKFCESGSMKCFSDTTLEWDASNIYTCYSISVCVFTCMQLNPNKYNDNITCLQIQKSLN